MSILIEKAGKDCIIIETRRIHNCDAQKLKDTVEGKEGVRYTEHEMKAFGFTLREAK